MVINTPCWHDAALVVCEHSIQCAECSCTAGRVCTPCFEKWEWCGWKGVTCCYNEAPQDEWYSDEWYSDDCYAGSRPCDCSSCTIQWMQQHPKEA